VIEKASSGQISVKMRLNPEIIGEASSGQISHYSNFKLRLPSWMPIITVPIKWHCMN